MSTKKMYKDMTIHHYKFRRKPNRSIGGDIGVYLFLAFFSAIMMFPLVFAIANSLKPLDEILKFPPDVFPRRPTFDNFSDLFVTLSQGWVPLTRYIWNTLFVISHPLFFIYYKYPPCIYLNCYVGTRWSRPSPARM